MEIKQVRFYAPMSFVTNNLPIAILYLHQISVGLLLFASYFVPDFVNLHSGPCDLMHRVRRAFMRLFVSCPVSVCFI